MAATLPSVYHEVSSSCVSLSEYIDRSTAPSKAGTRDSTLAFFNISYSIRSGWKKRKQILEPLSGIMRPGLNAVLGATGSGKTTLLDVLADRKASGNTTGVVGYKVSSGGSRASSTCTGSMETQEDNVTIGYVVQDDFVTGALTVRENLFFSAALRLPSHMTMRERARRVQNIIHELHLSNCSDRKIGTEYFRGLSGGERKRTSIGMELITEPQILFLDEPTTGLDAHTAVSVIHLLKGLTDSKSRIVVMSIHQPRYSIFKLFDTLTLLSRGSLVYHGPAGTALDYFKCLGYECEDHDNPADFFLDIIDSKGPVVKRPKSRSSNIQVTDLTSIYQSSAMHLQTQKELQLLLPSCATNTASINFPYSRQYSSSPIWQLLVLCYRSGMKMWRNPMTNLIQVLVAIVFATIVGAIYFQRPNTPRGMNDRIGVLFFVVMSQVFYNMGAVELFIKERALFLHETSGGYYRVSSFFLAKVLTDLLILRFLPLTIFCVISYFMIGLEADVSKFFIYYLTLGLTTLSGASIAFAFSAMVSVFAVANLLVALVFIISMLFGGFLIGLSSLPSWIQWMKYLSLFRFAIEALTTNELKGRTFSEVLVPINGTVDLTKCVYRIHFDHQTNQTLCEALGDSVLKFQGYQSQFPWIWYDQAALLFHSCLWLFMTYVILRVIKSYYRQ